MEKRGFYFDMVDRQWRAFSLDGEMSVDGSSAEESAEESNTSR